MSDDDRSRRGEVMPPSSSSPFTPLPGLPGRRGWLRSSLAYWLDYYSERKALEGLARAYDAAARAARAGEGYEDALVGFKRAKGRGDDIDLILEEDRDRRRVSANDAKVARIRSEQRLDRLQNSDAVDGEDPEHLDDLTRTEEAKGRYKHARERAKTEDERRKERLQRMSGQPREVIDTLLDMQKEHKGMMADVDDLVSAGLMAEEEAKHVRKTIEDAYRAAVERIKSGIF